MQRYAHLAAWLVMLVAAAHALAGQDNAERVRDTALDRAEQMVEESDRYMHQRELRRGMTGYGLTVVEGTSIERFEVEILSVLRGQLPQQDIILARLSGLGMEDGGVYAGMSGSPVYIRDPDDGEEKLIGAVAMGWSGQKIPLCGIQPISQMLAVTLSDDEEAGDLPGAAARRTDMSRDEFLSVVLDPHKRDFAPLIADSIASHSPSSPSAEPKLEPLATPLAVSGVSPHVLEMLRTTLEPAGIVPVQVGGDSGRPDDAEDAELVPGAVLSIPVVSGDVQWFASGTVTEVVGEDILAFGHGFFYSGDLDLPMGPGYVHTVVPHIMRSFKIAAPLEIAGSLTRDEVPAITGRVGEPVDRVPVTVNVHWEGTDRRQVYNYEVSRHRDLTPLMTVSLMYESTLSWHDPPVDNTMHYSVVVEYEDLGRYEVTNVTTGLGLLYASSDASRPLYALENNPFAPPPKLKSVSMDLSFIPEDTGARIRDLRLDSRTYNPGDTVTGTVILRPFRDERVSLPFSFDLPEDIAEGTHRIGVYDNVRATEQRQQEMPHRFDPESLEELFVSLNRVVKKPADRLYVRLPLQNGGLALSGQELPGLPASRAGIFARAGRLDALDFVEAKVEELQTDYVLSGSAVAEFEVRKRPQRQLRIRQEGVGN